MNKKAQVVILPSDKENAPIILSGFDTLFLHPPMNIKSSDTLHHLYFVTNDEIKVGQYYIDTNFPNKVSLLQRAQGTLSTDKKIIASTDRSLKLPVIRHLFVVKYVELQGTIDQVELIVDNKSNPVTNTSGEVYIESINQLTLEQAAEKYIQSLDLWEDLNGEITFANLKEAFIAGAKSQKLNNWK